MNLRDDAHTSDAFERAFERAARVMPGGVNSPVRAFGAVGGTPRFFKKGRGAILTAIDDNEYIDYVGSWGPLILGHADPRIVDAVQRAAAQGCSFGAPTEAETRLAEMIVKRVPSIEKVRLVNSGTEATMSALRLARAFTRRTAVIKFEGCYHGHVDALLVKSGSGPMTLNQPSSPGIPDAATADTIVLPFNDIDAVRKAFETNPDRIAAVIVEPIAANMGLIPPIQGFLEGLRECCSTGGAILIFDEIITGFRVAPGGAQQLFGILPDLTCLGKILGGGLPLAAYGGAGEIMNQVSPAGPVYQAGTLSGNPVATAAGIATLEALSEPGVYEALEAQSAALATGLTDAADRAGVSMYAARVGSLICNFMTSEEVTNHDTAVQVDTGRYAAYFHAMLDRGIYLAPSQFECMFVSTAHAEEHIDRTIAAAREAFATPAAD